MVLAPRSELRYQLKPGDEGRRFRNSVIYHGYAGGGEVMKTVQSPSG